MRKSGKEFEITKKYADEIISKVEVFRAATGTKKSIFMTFITTFGLNKGPYNYLVQNCLTVDDLFLPVEG